MVARLAISIIFISIVISGISTSILIYSNYQENDRQFSAQLSSVKKNNLPALTNALWYFDQMQINTQGEWISSLPHIDYVKVSSQIETFFEKGSVEEIAKNDLILMPLIYNDKILGSLEMGFARQTSLSDLIQPISKAIVLQLISLFLLTLFLIWGVHRYITRHLEDINQQLQRKLSSGKHQRLKLNRLPMNDELATVVDSVNLLNEMAEKELQLKDKVHTELATSNHKLKQIVNERTQSLQTALDELNNTLDDLTDTQSQLIESEKLSSLGALVAGVVHEVKTPVGLCITTHSFIKDLFKDLQKHVNEGNISKESFADYMENMEECVDILSKNLARTSTLVESFKHVSEDQAGEILRSFNLAQYLGEILFTLSPKLKTSGHCVQINCPDDITVTSYPGAFSQVIINLIMNSLMHGFEGISRGNITIQAEQLNGEITITYSDDGIGMSEEVTENIFTPFYTTKQGSGGTGLGMHLVKTIVEQTLQGNIKVQPSAKGCTFVITISVSIN